MQTKAPLMPIAASNFPDNLPGDSALRNTHDAGLNYGSALGELDELLRGRKHGDQVGISNLEDRKGLLEQR
jgi:hypothetical protein